MNAKNTLRHLTTAAPEEMAELKAALKSAPPCEDCGGTGICGDEGPGMRNARHEWMPCECPLGRLYTTIPECLDEWKAQRIRLKVRIAVLEDALNEIYHWSTEQQMGIIRRVLGPAANPDVQLLEAVKQKGPPPPKTFPERLLALAHWIRGRVDSDALPSTTMTMLRQRVDRMNKWDHKNKAEE